MTILPAFAAAGITVASYEQYVCPDQLTNDSQTIGVAEKDVQLRRCRTSTYKEDKLRHIAELRRLYGRNAKIYITNIPENAKKAFFAVYDGRFQLNNEGLTKNEEEEINTVIEKLINSKLIEGRTILSGIFSGATGEFILISCGEA